MKIITHLMPRYLLLAFIILAFVLGCRLEVTAQKAVKSADEQLLPPLGEKFKAATDLVSPWRSSGCIRVFSEFSEPDCYFVNEDIFKKSDTLTLYNSDGTLWYRFSLTYQSPDYFLRDTKMGFVPFATPYGYFGNPKIVLLRMVGESTHWYEVEVNEKTRATKFVLKRDPMWTATKWSRWLYEIPVLKPGGKQQLRDKADGKVIEELANITIDEVNIIKVEGDWAYVNEFRNEEGYRGWIRWRKGRDILVGCVLNGNKVPEGEIDVEDK